MNTVVDDVLELKKDYNKQKLCNYYCSLCELKYIDLFDPYIFWDFVKNESKYYNIEIKLKKQKYFIKTSYLGRGEYFKELEYGILYMISKTLKSMIERCRYVRLVHPEIEIDWKVWNNYKKEIRTLAFNNFLEKQGK